jgi:hypothetical protein
VRRRSGPCPRCSCPWGKWGQSGFFVEPVPMRSIDPTEKLHSDPISRSTHRTPCDQHLVSYAADRGGTHDDMDCYGRHSGLSCDRRLQRTAGGSTASAAPTTGGPTHRPVAHR